MAHAEQGAQAAGRTKLCNSTVFLIGNIEPTMEWYKRLGFESEYYPPGFAILSRDTPRQTISGGFSATRGTCTSSLTI